MGRPIPVADKAVGMAALIAVLEDLDGVPLDQADREAIAVHLIAAASKVKFQPSTRQLVMTFDLAFSAAEPSTTE